VIAERAKERKLVNDKVNRSNRKSSQGKEEPKTKEEEEEKKYVIPPYWLVAACRVQKERERERERGRKGKLVQRWSKMVREGPRCSLKVQDGD
jgi:hypothetical protein